VDFHDWANPTEAEVREWAFLLDEYYPSEDWDIVIALDASLDHVFLELASDPKCPNRQTFLSVLYIVVGDAVRTKWSTRSEPYLRAFINSGLAHPDHQIQSWAARSFDLIANPSSFDYYLWCSGGFARS
jgi:hypothetical protein